MVLSIIAALDHHVVFVNFFFILIFILLPCNLPLVISETRIISTSASCSSFSSSTQGLQILFPFQLQRQNPARPSGGFSLVCKYSTGEKEKQNAVLLQLPGGSGDFIVRSISYSSKEVEITDPLFCLPRKLLQFNVDALLKQTPYYGDYHYSFSLYNCSTSMTRRLSSSSCQSQYGVIDCLSGDQYRVIVISSSDMMMMSASFLVRHQNDCVLIGNISLTTSRTGLTPYEFSRHRSLYLTWVDPGQEYRQLGERQGDDHYHGIGDHMQPQMKYDYSYYYSPPPPSPPYSYYPYSSPPPNLSNNTIVAATVLAILFPILMILLCICAYRFCVQSDNIATATNVRNPTTVNRRNPAPNSPQEATTTTAKVLAPGLDQSVIDTFPTMVIQGEDQWLARLDDKTCSICLSNYEHHDVLKILPGCLHKFHGDCVDEWLRSNGICPICRTVLPKS